MRRFRLLWRKGSSGRRLRLHREAEGEEAAEEEAPEVVARIRIPLPTLIERAKKFWRARFTEEARRSGAKRAFAKPEKQLQRKRPGI
jgi:hypothetical protein